MDRTGRKLHRFGLVGRNISYSFSKSYFTNKFRELGLKDHVYENFDLPRIDQFPDLIRKSDGLCGLNVTIPYKESIIPYLDELDLKAQEIGAVNTVQISANGLKGFNTDIFGFARSLMPHLVDTDRHALILGTGGASKAVAYVLSELELDFRLVSRKPDAGQLSYEALDQEIIHAHTVIVNTTPLGTFPEVDKRPQIPYEHLDGRHLLFDLIYNPPITAFLKEGKNRGTRIANGQNMLELQAEKAWEIWNTP